MQRTKEELEELTQADLVLRVLELQDMLREGLKVRDALHAVLNDILKVKSIEVAQFAALEEFDLSPDEVLVKRMWAQARHAVSNPLGAARMGRELKP